MADTRPGNETRVLMRRFGFLLMVLGCATCGDDSPSDVVDTDADVPTGGLDATSDLVGDGGREASDTALEIPNDAGPAEWVPLPGLPDDCKVELAQNPEALLSLQWSECGPGCSTLTLPPGGSVVPTSRYYDDAGYFQVQWLEGDELTVALATTSSVHGAWRSLDIRQCAFSTADIGVGDGWTAYEVLRFSLDGINLIYHVPTEELSVPHEPALVMNAPEDYPPGNAFQNLRASEQGFAAWIAPLGEVLLHSAGTTYRHATRDSAAPGSPQLLQFVGDHALWVEWETELRIAHGSPDQETGIYYAVPGVRLIGFSTDGEELAWVQCYGWDGGRCERKELWTAPYVRNPNDLEPRIVIADYTGPSGGTVGFGKYVERNVGFTFETTDLTNGEVSRFSLPADYRILSQRPVYVGPDEVAFAIRTGIGSAITLIRVSFDAFTPVE